MAEDWSRIIISKIGTRITSVWGEALDITTLNTILMMMITKLQKFRRFLSLSLVDRSPIQIIENPSLKPEMLKFKKKFPAKYFE